MPLQSCSFDAIGLETTVWWNTTGGGSVNRQQTFQVMSKEQYYLAYIHHCFATFCILACQINDSSRFDLDSRTDASAEESLELANSSANLQTVRSDWVFFHIDVWIVNLSERIVFGVKLCSLRLCCTLVLLRFVSHLWRSRGSSHSPLWAVTAARRLARCESSWSCAWWEIVRMEKLRERSSDDVSQRLYHFHEQLLAEYTTVQ